jgi:hypothetical protein
MSIQPRECLNETSYGNYHVIEEREGFDLALHGEKED